MQRGNQGGLTDLCSIFQEMQSRDGEKSEPERREISRDKE